MNDNTENQLYNNTGILDFGVHYEQATIAKWNRALDPIFLEKKQVRTYADASTLFDLGILQDLLTDKVKSCILKLEPNPVFFHCHAYEIPASSKVNHIGFHDVAGWHRDFVEPNMISQSGSKAFSIFIYLTDVDTEANGAFELLPEYFEGDKIFAKKSHRFFGKAGTCFFWDRSLYHRPHPNTSPTPRRIIKLSIQSNGWRNSRIHLDEFLKLKKSATTEPLIAYMAGDNYTDSISSVPLYNTLNTEQNEKIPSQVNPVEYNARVLYRPKITPIIRRVSNKLKKVVTNN